VRVVTDPDGRDWLDPSVGCEPDVDTVIAGDQALPGPIGKPWWDELEGETELFCVRAEQTSDPLVVYVPELPLAVGVTVGLVVFAILRRLV
jgi:hypothetical protein